MRRSILVFVGQYIVLAAAYMIVGLRIVEWRSLVAEANGVMAAMKSQDEDMLEKAAALVKEANALNVESYRNAREAERMLSKAEECSPVIESPRWIDCSTDPSSCGGGVQ